MDAFFDLSWRFYPSALLMLNGALLLFFGAQRCLHGLLRETSTAQVLTLMRGFRIGVLGVPMAGFGAGWLWQLEWLLVLALVFGLEEFFESSAYISLLTGQLAQARS